MNRRKIALLLVGFCLVGCAARRPAPTNNEPPDVMGPPIPDTHVETTDVEVYGPAAPAVTETAISQGPSTETSTAVMVGPPVPAAGETVVATATATSTATTTATATAPAEAGKLCLVLGPGMAKAMAEVAVLEAVRKAKIPVHCVVGTEMGAVVGALYAQANGNVNSLQWQLFKLNKDNYFNFPMLSLRDPKSTGKELNKFLRGVFRDARVESLPIRFATTAVSEDGEDATELGKGPVAEALSASVAVPGIFEPWKIGDAAYHSAAAVEPAPLQVARGLGGNFLVLVDVLADAGAATKSRYHRAFAAARSVLKLQKKEAQFVITVNTSSIGFDDFGRRADIMTAGSAAADKALPDLKAAWEKWSNGH